MTELLAKARARVVRHLMLDKGALALTIGMGGLIVLLLIGTQVLNWWWPLILAAGSLGVGLYELRKHIPSLYQIAQRIDQRLSLADSLSTAVYFSEHPKPGTEAVCALQLASAERLASTVNVEQALPLSRSRYLLPGLALLAVAGGLFVTRYFVLGSLDLNQSLLSAAIDQFFTSPVENEEEIAKLNLRAKSFDPRQPNGPSEEDPSVFLPADEEKGSPLNKAKEGASESSSQNPEPDQQQQKKGDEGGEESQASNDKQNDQNKDQQREGEDKGDQSSQGDDQRSMMDKIRDAVNNLMNKLNQDEGEQKNAKGGNSKQKQQKGQKQEKGDSQDQSEQAEGEGEPDQDQQGDKGKPQDGKQANAPGQKPSEQASSGAGENDGQKKLEEAKAQAAMGKVSELLAQRAAEVKGQVMMEVTSTKQTLRTAMTEQQAGHRDAGGAIHRDQVPLADQLFVEQYFKEVRKGASGPAAAANPNGTSGTAAATKGANPPANGKSAKGK